MFLNLIFGFICDIVEKHLGRRVDFMIWPREVVFLKWNTLSQVLVQTASQVKEKESISQSVNMCLVGLFTLNELRQTEPWLIFKGTQKPIKSFSQVLFKPHHTKIVRVYEFRLVNVILQLFKIRLFWKVLPSHQNQVLHGKLLFISWVKNMFECLFIFVHVF